MATLFDDPKNIRREGIQALATKSGSNIGTAIGVGLGRLFGRDIPGVESAKRKQQVVKEIMSETGSDGKPYVFGSIEFFDAVSNKLYQNGFLKEAADVNEIRNKTAEQLLAQQNIQSQIDAREDKLENFWRFDSNGKVVRETAKIGSPRWDELVASNEWIKGNPEKQEKEEIPELQSFRHTGTGQIVNAPEGTTQYDDYVKNPDLVAISTPSASDFKSEKEEVFDTRNYFKFNSTTNSYDTMTVIKGSKRDKDAASGSIWTEGTAPTTGRIKDKEEVSTFYNARLDTYREAREGTREHDRMVGDDSWTRVTTPTAEQMKKDKPKKELDTRNFYRKLPDGTYESVTVRKGSAEDDAKIASPEWIQGEAPVVEEEKAQDTQEYHRVMKDASVQRALVRKGSKQENDIIKQGNWRKGPAPEPPDAADIVNMYNARTGITQGFFKGSKALQKAVESGEWVRTGDAGFKDVTAVDAPAYEPVGTIAQQGANRADAIENIVDVDSISKPDTPVTLNPRAIQALNDLTDDKIAKAPEGLASNLQEMLQKEIDDSNEFIGFGKTLFAPIQGTGDPGKELNLLELAAAPGKVTDVRMWLAGFEDQVTELFGTFGKAIPKNIQNWLSLKDDDSVTSDEISQFIYNMAALQFARLEFGAVYRGGGGGKITPADVEKARGIIGVTEKGELVGDKDKFEFFMLSALSNAERRKQDAEMDLRRPRMEYNREWLQTFADMHQATLEWSRYPKSLNVKLSPTDTKSHRHPKAGQQIAKITFKNGKEIYIDTHLKNATNLTINFKRQIKSMHESTLP